MLSLKRDGHLAKLVIQNPPLNVMNEELLQAFEEMLDELEQSYIRVLLLSGDGRAFMAGADIR